MTPADPLISVPSGVTEPLARFASTMQFSEIPEDVVQIAENAFIDTIGVTIAGAAEPVVSVLARVLAPGAGSSAAVGAARLVDPVTAATLNGTAAHALDYDDLLMGDGLTSHPSACLAPAALALAEDRRLSGTDVLTGYIAGFELQARLSRLLGNEHYGRGFHSTATLGAFGAAAAGSRLLGLDAGRLQVCLSIAATQASGLRRVFGTMGKPFQVGRASGAGVLSALLAESGFEAPAEVVGGERGFAELYAEGIKSGLTDLDRWYMRENLFKEHAACFGTHPTIDAICVMRDAIADPAEVQSIDVRVPPRQLQVCAIPDPKTGLEAKFSLAYTSAVALLFGTATDRDFEDSRVHDAAVRSAMQRVTLVADDALSELESVVRIRLTDGTELSHRVDSIQSVIERSPLQNRERIVGKFRALVEPILGPRETDSLIDALVSLREHAGLDSVLGTAFRAVK